MTSFNGQLFLVLSSSLVMQLSQVSPKISTLSELLVAQLALVWPNTSVLSEVVSQIAWLSELSSAVCVVTLEYKLIAIRTRIVYFDNFKPVFWSIFESLFLTFIRLHFFTFNLFYNIFRIVAFTFLTASLHLRSWWS